MRLALNFWLLFPPLAALAANTAQPPADSTVTVEMKAAATKIIEMARHDSQGLDRLATLCYTIGNRLTGSPALDRAALWAEAEWKKDGLDDVRREPVSLKVWSRGAESLELVTENGTRPLAMLGLGNSIGTTPEGITAPVLVVSDYEGLKQLGEKVRGKIVLFNHPMKVKDSMFEAYGEAVEYRWSAALEASKLGAAAALVRSVTTHSLRSPHTGSMRPWVAEDQPIPAAAVSVEDAEMLAWLFNKGMNPTVRLKMSAKTGPNVPGANVVAELRGRELPDEVVMIGGHLDSWDVGQGAHDDGAGSVMSMQALSLLKRLGLRPRRTIRAVLFANEECGLDGGRAYAAAHGAEAEKHFAAMEADSGGFRPIGFSMTGNDAARSTVFAWKSLFEPLGATAFREGGSGADVGPMVAMGVPGLGLSVESTHYFDYHHTQADTFDKIVPTEFNDSVAAFTLMAWLLAETPNPLPHQAPKKSDE